MAENSLAPAFIKIFYTVSSLPHTMVLPVLWQSGELSGDPATTVLQAKGGGTVTVSAFITAFMAVLKPLYHTSSEFQFYEFWLVEDVGSDPIFIFNQTIAQAGTAATTTLTAGQMVISFRTNAGGNKYLYFMEPCASSALLQDTAPFGGSTAHKAVADYVCGATSPIVGRDNGFLAAPIRMLTKYNDTLRRKRLFLPGS